MDWRDHIHSDPQVLVGKPVIRGTRISVELLLDLFGGGWTMAEVLENYPHITEEQVRAAFAYAAEAVRDEATPEHSRAA